MKKITKLIQEFIDGTDMGERKDRTKMKNIPLQKIMEDCKKSKKKIALKDVADIVEGSLSLLYNQGSILKRVEKKIGDKDFNILVTSCLSTLMGSLYATCEGKFKNEQEAIKYGQSIGAMGVAIKKGK